LSQILYPIKHLEAVGIYHVQVCSIKRLVNETLPEKRGEVEVKDLAAPNAHAYESSYELEHLNVSG
jgi:hypothetical protein